MLWFGTTPRARKALAWILVEAVDASVERLPGLCPADAASERADIDAALRFAERRGVDTAAARQVWGPGDAKPSRPRGVVERDKVWVIVIDHRHGTDTYAAGSENGAYRRAAAYCRDSWGERWPDSPTGYAGLTEREIVAAYFADHPDEWMVLQPCTLEA